MRKISILTLHPLPGRHRRGPGSQEAAQSSAKAEATLNGKKITIDYSAPSSAARDHGRARAVREVWRTGANAAPRSRPQAI